MKPLDCVKNCATWKGWGGGGGEDFLEGGDHALVVEEGLAIKKAFWNIPSEFPENNCS